MHARTPESVVDLPVLVADFIADTVFDTDAVLYVGQCLAALPVWLTSWLDSELRTPVNSAAPHVTISDPGPWNGVIFLTADDPSYWVLSKSGGGVRGRRRGAPSDGEPWPGNLSAPPYSPDFSPDPYDQPGMPPWLRGL